MPTAKINPAFESAVVRGVSAPAADDIRRGQIQTQVTPTIAWMMIGVFLAMILAPAGIQTITELRQQVRPQVLNLFFRTQFPNKSDLKIFEDALHDQSVAKRFFQPRVQEAVTGLGEFGNSQCTIGRGNWLFYRPGVEYVTGPAFLNPAQLAKRSRNWRDAAEKDLVSPDPRPAILSFNAYLHKLGIHLVLAPIPDKVTLQPEQLSRRWPGDSTAPPNNPSFAAWVHELRQAGVDIFDPTPAKIPAGNRLFLRQDTHWTPQWMDEVAQGLAAHIRTQVPDRKPISMRLADVNVSHVGDLVELLRVTEKQKIFSPETITVQKVLDPEGKPIRSSPQAPVLLLGDSFSNIFSDEGMGWGPGAGFGEHLAYHLRQPIHCMNRNGAGASATREFLAEEMARGQDPLAGKKVVIWEFAVRELAVGDWKEIDLNALSAGKAAAKAPVEAIKPK